MPLQIAIFATLESPGLGESTADPHFESSLFYSQNYVIYQTQKYVLFEAVFQTTVGVPIIALTACYLR